MPNDLVWRNSLTVWSCWAGEILGTKQTGEMSLRIADLERDAQWLEMAYELAQEN